MAHPQEYDIHRYVCYTFIHFAVMSQYSTQAINIFSTIGRCRVSASRALSFTLKHLILQYHKLLSV